MKDPKSDKPNNIIRMPDSDLPDTIFTIGDDRLRVTIEHLPPVDPTARVIQMPGKDEKTD